MRFYPFGSGSQITSLATTSSLADYALTGSSAVRILSASVAVSGTRGTNGTDGVCIYTQGPQGFSGSVGLTGFSGVASEYLPFA